MLKFRLNFIRSVLKHNYERKVINYTRVVIEQLCQLSAAKNNENVDPKKSVGAKNKTNLSSKQVLRRFFNLIRTKSGSSQFDLKYTTESITKNGSKWNGLDPKWRTRLSINWPRDVVFEGTGRKKVDAETKAAALAFQSLKDIGVVDEDNEPVLSNDSQPKGGDSGIEGFPKVILENAFRIVQNDVDAVHKLRYQSKMFRDRRFYSWETTLTLTWPKQLVVTATGIKKKDSESGAALKALQHLREVGALNENNDPLVNTEHEIEEFLSDQRSVPHLEVDEELLKRIDGIVQEIRSLNLVSNLTSSSTFVSSLADADDFLDHDAINGVPVADGLELRDISCNGPILDIFSGTRFSIQRERTLESRNFELLNKLVYLRENSIYVEDKSKLPITNKRRQILELIERHPVVVIVGDTGCGKTTQLPQFVLDDLSERMEGSSCNMIVTQPRRIAAISIAHRVAAERSENLGGTIGYRVRLDSIIPSKPGRILFCSTGDFMQRLLNNPQLIGVSHVVLDEVHERDVQIDFLLILLQDIVRRKVNPELRIVVMSATLDHQRLSRYFDDCPVCHVEGFLHPVTEYFSEDLKDFLLLQRQKQEKELGTFHFDVNAVVELIQNVSETRPLDGAILCFLPGWQEIKMVRGILAKRMNDGEATAASWILPVHSKLSQKDQSRIFDRPPPNVRKIVLATNIAEASITVDDVVYVIDCGLHREKNYNSYRGVSCLETLPISLANVKQRRGRAGRTRPGECFHLFPKDALKVLAEFPTPEMQRTSLETIVLNAKAYFPDCKAVALLAKALDPPPIKAITAAVKELKDLDILDDDERLTPLGQLVLPFTAHPRLAKAIVYAAAFRCVDPILTLAAILSANRDIFLHGEDDTMDLKKEIKRQFAKRDESSDHLISVGLFDAWLEMTERRESKSAVEFCNTHGLNGDALLFAKGIRNQLKWQLHQTIRFLNNNLDDNSDPTLVKSILVASFYPNVVQLKKGSIRKSRIVRDSSTYLKPNGVPVALLADSINKVSPPVDLPWLTYFTSVHSAQRRREVVRETSAVPLVSLLLFAGHHLSVRKVSQRRKCYDGDERRDEDFEVFLSVDDNRVLRCQCSTRVANSLIDLRKSMELYLRFLFANHSKDASVEEADTTDSARLSMVRGQLVDIIVSLLQQPKDE